MSDGLTMGSIVRRSASQYPNRTAYIFEGEKITFATYNSRVNKAANALSGLGAEKGQHVAVLGQNSVRYLEVSHAAAKLGLVFGPINWRLSGTEIAFIVTDADNRILLVEAEFQPLVSEIMDELSDVTIVVYGGEVSLPGALNYEELFQAASDDEPDVEVNGNDPAVIMYTSGTTGLPKGAVLSHANVVWDSMFALTYVPPRHDDCFLLSMPMSHVSGLHTQTTTFMQRGLPVVIMRQWEPELACQLMERHRVTIAYILVTPLIQLMESGAHKRYDLTALSRVMTAAAKYTPEFVASVMAALEIEKFYFMYGLTEASPIVSTTEVSAQMIVKPNTLGFPVWYCDVQIVDDNGVELPKGSVGEIVVRGPNVFQGYYKRPDANREVLRDGWLHTGDLGYMDDDNFMFFVDRKKDMIKSGGENVYSLEVELALGRLVPEIAEVSVVGVPHDKWGEAVTAFVVAKPEVEISAEEIVSRARKELAGYKLPKAVHFVDELPKNVSGKVLKRQLRDEFLNSQN